MYDKCTEKREREGGEEQIMGCVLPNSHPPLFIAWEGATKGETPIIIICLLIEGINMMEYFIINTKEEFLFWIQSRISPSFILDFRSILIKLECVKYLLINLTSLPDSHQGWIHNFPHLLVLDETTIVRFLSLLLHAWHFAVIV